MKIQVAIKGPGLNSLLHEDLFFRCDSGLACQSSKGQLISTQLKVQAKDGQILAETSGKAAQNLGPSLKLISKNKSPISVSFHPGRGLNHRYLGELVLKAWGSRLSIILECDLEVYVAGVLRSEVPASFALEAMRAQAVLARTYGLNPRLSHEPDGADVCDSYLCCQAFNGIDDKLSSTQRLAIKSTSGCILSWQGNPALALFSACAGGHTEDYANCFSDPKTNRFPDLEIPYLKAVAESAKPFSCHEEKDLRKLYFHRNPPTYDDWSPSFSWTLKLRADQIEAHMHHVIATMQKDPSQAAFIEGPPGNNFSQVKSFEVGKRGASGQAMELIISTRKGDWLVKKELVIRSVFANPELKLKRLRSAKVFFEQSYDKLGLLKDLTIFGLGNGHGVGLQQVGAQGQALKGLKAEQILAHYYPGCNMKRVE